MHFKTPTADKVVLTNVQALRAFAALNVVFYHVFGTARNYGFPLSELSFLEGWGRNGVDLFFVISGFIMVFIQNTKHKTPAVFLMDRIRRIVPLYWALNLFLVLLLLVLPALFKELILSVNWTLSSLFFISRVAGHETPLIFPGWTLELEMFFYFLFAISLFARTQFNSFWVTTSLIVASIVFFGLNRIALEFVFGMLIGLIYLNRSYSLRTGLICLCAGAAALFASLWIKIDFEIARFVIFGVPSAFIVFGCITISQLPKGWATRLGDASYSIYLIQMFTIPAFYKVMQKLTISAINNDLLAILCLIATALAGLALYEWFEIKLAHRLKEMRRS